MTSSSVPPNVKVAEDDYYDILQEMLHEKRRKVVASYSDCMTRSNVPVDVLLGFTFLLADVS